jgi:hypothetical protein
VESREAEGMKDRLPSPERQSELWKMVAVGRLSRLVAARVAPSNSSTPIDNGF